MGCLAGVVELLKFCSLSSLAVRRSLLANPDSFANRERRTAIACNQTKTPPKLCCRNIPAAEVRMYQCAELRILPTDRAMARHWTVQSGHCRDRKSTRLNSSHLGI